MTKSKFERTIESFEKMDLNMLEVLLDENKAYLNMTKDTFLKKIGDAFDKLKRKGDTVLVAHKGSCGSVECGNNGCSGYSFIGDKSKDYLDFVIEELDGLYFCYSFQTNDPTIEKGTQIELVVFGSEDIINKPSAEYLEEVRPFATAINELFDLQNSIIDKTIYLPWVEKYQDLYDSFEDNDVLFWMRQSNNEYNHFYSLYTNIETLSTILKSYKPAREAVREFETVDVNNDKQLLKWLVKYEVERDNLSRLDYVGIDPEFPDKIEQLEYLDYKELMISAKDFVNVTKLKHLFDKYYWKMLDKYDTYTNEEINNLSMGEENEHTISSLTFHVNRAGINLD